MISIIIFTLLYSIKGGWHWRIPKLKSLDHGVMGFFLDGTRLSSILALIYIAVMADDPIKGLLFGLAWFVGIMMSMGEEAGAVGRYGHAWGPYIDKGFGREYGVKKALQRGVFLGALLTLATGFTPFIVAGATFPIVYFAGSTLTYLIEKRPQSWPYAEPIYGAMIGIAAYLWLGA